MNVKSLLNIQKGIAYVISFFLFIPFSYMFYEPFIDIKRAITYIAILILGICFFSFKKRIRISMSLFLIIFLCMLSMLSLIWSQNKPLSFFSITNYIFFIALFIIGQNSWNVRKGLFNGALMSGILTGVYVLLQSIKIDPFRLGGRVATIGNSNYLGVILLFWVSYFFYTYLFKKEKKHLLLFLFFSISLVLGSRMRSAILAFFTGLTIFSLYKKNRIFIGVMIFFMIFGSVLVAGELLKGQPSFWIRYYIGRDSIKGVFSSVGSAIVGFGENAYMDSFGKFRSVDAYRVGGNNIYSISSHNIFIDNLFELGIMGSITFFLLVLSIFKESENRMRFVFLSVLICAQFINPIKHISTFYIFFMPIIFSNKRISLKKRKVITLTLIFILAFLLIPEYERLKNSIYAMDYFKDKMPSGNPTCYDSGLYLFEKANFYRRKNQHKKAEKVYLDCLERLPYFIPALFNTGQMYYDVRQYKKAYKYFKKVIGLNPIHNDAWFFKGAIEYKRVQYNESAKSLERAYLLSGKKDKQALELLLKIKNHKYDIFDN